MDDYSTLMTISFILAGIWLLTIIITLVSIYRRNDFSTVVKLLWTFIIIVAPLLGLIAYFIWAAGKRTEVNKSGE